MIRTAPFLAAVAILLLPTSSEAREATGCIRCHSDPRHVPKLEHRLPVTQFEGDVHRERELSCHDCHGGDPQVGPGEDRAYERAHDSSRGYLGMPAAADVPSFCGRCHSDPVVMGRYNPDARTDQVEKYRTSVHGQRLVEGDHKVANCISCHGRHPGGEMADALAHGITALSDPLGPVYPLNVAATCSRCHSDTEYMNAYGIPTDQYAKYEQSVHRAQMVEKEDLSAPTCNDCHGNHGARPPEVESVAFVCGGCHGKQAELFRQSKLKPAFDEAGIGECLACHGNHRVRSPTDDLLFHRPRREGEARRGCHVCHQGAEDPALMISTEMRAEIRALVESIDAAAGTIDEARGKGMPVTEAEYRLSGATDSLIEARVLVHLFRVGPVKEACDEGAKVCADAREMGEEAIRGYYFRHRWLGISLIGIGFVIFALVLKVRQVDRRWRSRRSRTAQSFHPQKERT